MLSSILLLYFHVQYVGSAWDELKHIRQAVGFLVRTNLVSLCKTNFHMITCLYLTLSPLNFLQVIHQKPKKTLHEITNELCPVRRLSSIFLFCSCSSLLFLKYGCFFYFSEEKKFLFLYRILIRCFSFIIHMAIFY